VVSFFFFCVFFFFFWGVFVVLVVFLFFFLRLRQVFSTPPPPFPLDKKIVQKMYRGALRVGQMSFFSDAKIDMMFSLTYQKNKRAEPSLIVALPPPTHTTPQSPF